MSEPDAKVVSLAELVAIRSELRTAGKTVVQCHGCFDIVHPGHIRYLRFARAQGDVLIVSVSADDVVGKGADRPYITEALRLENLAALEAVDYVCLSHDSWAGPALEQIRPDVYVKGKEYESNSDPRFVREKQLVEGYGGRVIFSSGDVVFSSTTIVNQFRDRFGLEQEKLRLYCKRHEVDRSALARLMASFAGKRVLVLADPILDRYVHCEPLGIAADTPILAVTALREDLFVGAGALVAAQIAALGGRSSFLTLLGHGETVSAFERGVGAAGVDLMAVRSDERSVFLKTRYVVDDRKVLKVDTGFPSPPSSSATRELIAALESAVPAHDALIVTDFGYGLFNAELTEAVARIAAKNGIPYFADVSSRRVNVLKFKRPRLATPTEDELRFAFADSESGLSHLASRYYQESQAENLILTMGKRGLLFFAPPDAKGDRLRTDYLPAFADYAVDPVGAGDVFLATTALSNLAGGTIAQAAYLASCVSAIHVGRLGNEAVDGMLIEGYLAARPELGS